MEKRLWKAVLNNGTSIVTFVAMAEYVLEAKTKISKYHTFDVEDIKPLSDDVVVHYESLYPDA